VLGRLDALRHRDLLGGPAADPHLLGADLGARLAAAAAPLVLHLGHEAGADGLLTALVVAHVLADALEGGHRLGDADGPRDGALLDRRHAGPDRAHLRALLGDHAVDRD